MNRTQVFLLAALMTAAAGCKKSDDTREAATVASPATEGEAAPAAGGHQFDPGDRWNLAASPVKGSENAIVTIVEFSEFQCPFCARVLPTLTQILETPEFADKVRIVYKHLPLDFHDRAEPAARAAVAAQNQGKFWEFHDVVFENMRALSDADLEGYAQRVGLDMDRYRADFAAPETAARVAADLALSQQLGIRGTPNFLINGRAIAGAQPFDNFAAIIREEITATQALIDGGQTPQAAFGARLDANVAANAAAQNQPEQQQRPAEPDPNAEMYVPVGQSATMGPEDALITIAIFSEFQCPYCARVKPTLDQIISTYGNDVRLVFKHRPLDFHDRAEPAARAAIAAQNQGKFWEFHDLAFANMQALTDDNFIAWATQLGLNLDQFRADIASPATAARVAEDVQLAERLQARGTPHFFINGYRLRGAQPFESFQRVIDERLTEARALIAAGTPRAGVYDALQADAIRGAAPMRQPAAAAAAEPAAPTGPFDINVEGAPFIGNATAPVVLVQYSDFTCGFCGRFHTTLYEAHAGYEDRVKIVFKHFPRGNPDHAIAAIAAQNQGKFWEYTDALFADRVGDRAGFEALAERLGLNMEQFRRDLDDPAVRQRAMDERAEGQRFGVRGTPTWFVNGMQHVGAMDAARVRQIWDAALTAAAE